MPYVEETIIIKGEIEKIYQMAKDMEKFPLFMPDVKKVKVVERTGNKTVTEWESMIDEDTPISWRELDEFDDKKPLIRYKLLEGDLEKFEGEWRFEKTPDGIKVTITCDFDFGMPAFEKIVGSVLKLKVQDNCKMMLSAIKKKVEEGG
jgi:ribosome-associated toxin RatA of RatAB toxin-antitoxin module